MDIDMIVEFVTQNDGPIILWTIGVVIFSGLLKNDDLVVFLLIMLVVLHI